MRGFSEGKLDLTKKQRPLFKYKNSN